MGNLYAESGLRSNNLQNAYETKLGYTDETYTAAVDNGTYTQFTEDKAGYGIAQWTFWSRKAALLNFCKEKNSSIGDLHTQLNFLWNELNSSYQQLLKILQSSESFQECSNAVLTQFERPADQGASVQQTRAKYSETYYNKYAQKVAVVNMNSNSPLVTVTKISPNKAVLNSKTINRISIHCYVGQVTAASGLENFSYSSTGASCNYIIGYDGSVGLCVEEKDRSWCTSSKSNDKQAITIEVASGKTEPYQVTDAAYKKLLDLITDICERNGKTKVIWNDNKDKTLAYTPKEDEVILTVHRWFRNKACPGTYLYERHGEIAKTVTARLNNKEEEEMTQEQFNTMMNNWIAEQASKEPGTWSAEARTWAEKNGLITGDTSGKKMYKKFLTREEFATVLYRALHRNFLD